MAVCVRATPSSPSLGAVDPKPLETGIPKASPSPPQRNLPVVPCLRRGERSSAWRSCGTHGCGVWDVWYVAVTPHDRRGRERYQP